MLRVIERAMRTLSLKSTIGLVVATSLTAGCGDDEIVGPPTNDDFASELGVDFAVLTETASGLYFQDIAIGTGAEAIAGTSVTVHYEGFLRDGRKFDSSRDINRPFTFQLGAGQVIAGWDEGVAGILVGGVRKLVIPPHLAYGSRGFGDVIPPNAWLVFDVELLEVE